jgi:hypothetical protein
MVKKIVHAGQSHYTVPMQTFKQLRMPGKKDGTAGTDLRLFAP